MKQTNMILGLVIIILIFASVVGFMLAWKTTMQETYNQGLEDGIKKTMSYIINETETNGFISLRDPETLEVTELIELDYSTETCAKACVRIGNA